MRRSYVVRMRWMVIYKYGVPGGALNLNSTNYPDHGNHGNLSLQGKIPILEPGIEPWTSWSVVRNSDHLDHEASQTLTYKISMQSEGQTDIQT
jgi:hypothetical protein